VHAVPAVDDAAEHTRDPGTSHPDRYDEGKATKAGLGHHPDIADTCTGAGAAAPVALAGRPDA